MNGKTTLVNKNRADSDLKSVYAKFRGDSQESKSNSCARFTGVVLQPELLVRNSELIAAPSRSA